ncbi:MAG: DUF1559 domain-containing protein [Planctomycetaceae bacterium]
MLPAVQQAREAARRSACKNNLKQLALALHNFEDTYKHFPAGAQAAVDPVPQPGSAPLIQGTTWLVFILPQIEQANIYQKYDFSVAYTNATNLAIGNFLVPTHKCPSGPETRSGNGSEVSAGTANHTTHYYGVMGPSTRANPSPSVFGGTTFNYVVGNPTTNGAYATDGVLQQYQDATGSVTTKFFCRFSDILDGTSNTLAIGERSNHLPSGQANDYRSWVRGNNGGSGTTKNVTYPINSTYYNGSNNFNDISFGSAHTGGAQFAFCDGTVKFISENIDMGLYRALASRSSREVAEVP